MFLFLTGLQCGSTILPPTCGATPSPLPPPSVASAAWTPRAALTEARQLVALDMVSGQWQDQAPLLACSSFYDSQGDLWYRRALRCAALCCSVLLLSLLQTALATCLQHNHTWLQYLALSTPCSGLLPNGTCGPHGQGATLSVCRGGVAPADCQQVWGGSVQSFAANDHGGAFAGELGRAACLSAAILAFPCLRLTAACPLRSPLPPHCVLQRCGWSRATMT